MKQKRIFILGGGISGLSASYHLNKFNLKNILFEKNRRVGGLLKNIKIRGFTFDQFVHFSFAKDEYTKKFFSMSSKYFVHKEPRPNNFCKNYWLEHSPQLHLYPLPFWEKIKIIISYIIRKKKKITEVKNYDEWLELSYGKYFKDNFTKKYTEKYWTKSPKLLETKWLEYRMPKIRLIDYIYGAFSKRYKNTFYGANLRYPQKGVYEAFLNILKKNKNIKTQKEITKLNLKKKIFCLDKKKKEYKFDYVISTIPLNELCSKIIDLPLKLKIKSKKLKYTSGIIVSIGLKKKIKFRHWFYVYDKSIIFSRVYSPSEKSKYNVPKNCSSIQLEIYFNQQNKKKFINLEKIKKKSLRDILRLKLFNKEDIIFADIRKIEYANIIFDHQVYKSRDEIIKYLNKNNIYNAGRYGEWKYLWSNQSFLSGKIAAEKIKSLI
jgi:protoporphyrinogen oxidase